MSFSIEFINRGETVVYRDGLREIHAEVNYFNGFILFRDSIYFWKNGQKLSKEELELVQNRILDFLRQKGNGNVEIQ
jgi:hypothetical protein